MSEDTNSFFANLSSSQPPLPLLGPLLSRMLVVSEPWTVAKRALKGLVQITQINIRLQLQIDTAIHKDEKWTGECNNTCTRNRL